MKQEFSSINIENNVGELLEDKWTQNYFCIVNGSNIMIIVLVLGPLHSHLRFKHCDRRAVLQLRLAVLQLRLVNAVAEKKLVEISVHTFLSTVVAKIHQVYSRGRGFPRASLVYQQVSILLSTSNYS